METKNIAGPVSGFEVNDLLTWAFADTTTKPAPLWVIHSVLASGDAKAFQLDPTTKMPVGQPLMLRAGMKPLFDLHGKWTPIDALKALGDIPRRALPLRSSLSKARGIALTC